MVFSDVGGVSSRAVLRRWPVLDVLLAAIRRVEGEIKALVKQEPGFDEDEQLLCSIPGIGFNSAVVIIAEMGDISLFRKPKQLAAYFGLDPGERQSGTFKGRKNKLSKRGSPLRCPA